MAQEENPQIGVHRAWCPSVTYAEDHSGEAVSRSLTGTIVLQHPLYLKVGEKRRQLHCISLRVKESSDSWTDNSNHESEAIVFGMKQGQRLFLSWDQSSNDVQAEYYGSLSSDIFQKYASTAKGSPSAWVSFYGPEHNSINPFELETDARPLVTQDLEINFYPGFVPDADWVATRQAEDLGGALSNTYLGHGQVKSVVDELCLSTSKAAGGVLSPATRQSHITHIRELVSQIRPAFLDPTGHQVTSYSSIWDLAAKDFEDTLKGRDDDGAKSLKSKYDNFWRHFNVRNVVGSGEKAYGARKEGFHPNVELLENLAATYCIQKNITSSFLEWSLLDSLVYAESIAFAQILVPGKTMFGYPIQSEIVPVSAGATFWKELKQFFITLTTEIVSIAFVYFVCSVLASSNQDTAWLMTTIVTAARWVAKAIAGQKKDGRAIAVELLSEMGTVHELLKTTAFNERGLKDAVYRVSAKGAVFSPWVLNLLDRRIARP
jgi:hypothetical protein